MKIIIPTTGSRDGVQPYINLTQGLRDAGHDVTLATNPTLCPSVEQHGVKAAPVGRLIWVRRPSGCSKSRWTPPAPFARLPEHRGSARDCAGLRRRQDVQF